MKELLIVDFFYRFIIENAAGWAEYFEDDSLLESAAYFDVLILKKVLHAVFSTLICGWGWRTANLVVILLYLLNSSAFKSW